MINMYFNNSLVVGFVVEISLCFSLFSFSTYFRSPWRGFLVAQADGPHDFGFNLNP